MNDLFQQEFNRTGQAIRELASRIRKLEVHTHVLAAGGDFVWMILLFKGGQLVQVYPTTSAGLDDASAAAVAPDIIFIPDCLIPDDHTFVAGVHYVGLSRRGTVLSGQITLGVGTVLDNLSIIRTANNANDLIGVQGPATGQAYIQDCVVTCTQSGAGNAYAINTPSGGGFETWMSDFWGTSIGGSGYAARSYDGLIYIYGGRCRGTADQFLVV